MLYFDAHQFTQQWRHDIHIEMNLITNDPKANSPDIWIDAFPKFDGNVNKYDRGHAVILGSEELIGATRLAASACSRIGAGLVTVLSEQATQSYSVSLPPDIMVKDCPIENLQKVTSLLGGPGGVSKTYMDMLLRCSLEIKRVFDAGALSKDLRDQVLGQNTILTPHDGEFEVVFGRLSDDRITQTRRAASAANCIIVRKGPKTIIAGPNGQCVINDSPNPFLAKAGTGDVLAGFITGLCAQSIPAFEACCAAVWIHSDAGDRLGPGLTASDLEFTLPEILRDIYDG